MDSQTTQRPDEAHAPAQEPTLSSGLAHHSRAVPPPPETLEDTGLAEDFVAGLVLKTLYVRGAALGFDLFDTLALPMAVLDDVIQDLQDHRLVEVHTTKGPRRGEYVFKLTGAGRTRAAEELELSRYVGPAPVPFEDFQHWVELQTFRRASVSEDGMRDVLDGIVVPDSMFDLLGPAVNSGRSLFLYGEPGNGKSLLAERIAHSFGNGYYVPFAVLVDGSVMILHDPVHHRSAMHDGGAERLEGEGDGTVRAEIVRSVPGHDRRFALAYRPVVVTGGELTLDQLDLQWDPTGRMYQAPPQLKAAGGVLVVDDLGRQRVPVRDLLNRWVVPLEHRQDYLTLRSGRKIVVPFDCFVIFSTNLRPAELDDEAFLRRIHYKIEVPSPSREEYGEILRGCCEDRGIPFEEGVLDFIFDEFYADGETMPRRCHPRDVLDHLQDLAGYRGEAPSLDKDLLATACQSYFVPSK